MYAAVSCKFTHWYAIAASAHCTEVCLGLLLVLQMLAFSIMQNNALRPVAAGAETAECIVTKTQNEPTCYNCDGGRQHMNRHRRLLASATSVQHVPQMGHQVE